MASVNFFSKEIQFKISNPRKTASWLKKICVLEKRRLESLTYVFCSDAFLQSLNKAYLRHKEYTDILSFDLSEDNAIHGEIYISIPTVRKNARIYKQPFEIELNRVIAHGLLHFLGYNDKSKLQKAEMRMKEEACLSLWK